MDTWAFPGVTAHFGLLKFCRANLLLLALHNLQRNQQCLSLLSSSVKGPFAPVWLSLPRLSTWATVRSAARPELHTVPLLSPGAAPLWRFQNWAGFGCIPGSAPTFNPKVFFIPSIFQLPALSTHWNPGPSSYFPVPTNFSWSNH